MPKKKTSTLAKEAKNYQHPASTLPLRPDVGTQPQFKRVRTRSHLMPHVLRNTWATLALHKGMSLTAVQKILRHDRPTTTAISLNLTDGHIVEEFEAKW